MTLVFLKPSPTVGKLFGIVMFLSLRSAIALLSAHFVLPHDALVVASSRQQPLYNCGQSHRGAEFRVAIIGAGIAGASAAYHLRNQSTGAFHSSPLAITIYEILDRVGGHVETTISPHGYTGRLSEPLELGASSFFKDDWCLMEAALATQTALTKSQPGRKTNDNGRILNRGRFLDDRFCEGTDMRARLWGLSEVKRAINHALNWLAFELKHYFLPWWIHYRLKGLREQLQHFGQNDTFSNVMQELKRCGLQDEVISSTASKFLERLGMTSDLQRYYMEPCIKDAFGLSLDEALGLHTVLSTSATRSNVSITAIDGNQRFIERLIEKSEAVVQLGSRVVRVEPGIKRRHALTVTSNAVYGKEQRSEYDAVIVTGNALANLRSSRSRALQGRQITTYKTHFATSTSLEPVAFGVQAANIPQSLLFTTEPALESANSSKSLSVLYSLITRPEFYIDRTGCQFDDECDQWTNVFIAKSSSVLSKESFHKLTRGHDDIAWTESHTWHRNVPVLNSSEPIFGDIQIEPFFFNAGNTVLDTLEMSCRMGRNAALKIFEQLSSAAQNLGECEPWTTADLLEDAQGLSQRRIP